MTWKSQVSCNNCFQVLLNEESTSIPNLPVTKSFQTSVDIILESEDLIEPNCNFF